MVKDKSEAVKFLAAIGDDPSLDIGKDDYARAVELSDDAKQFSRFFAWFKKVEAQARLGNVSMTESGCITLKGIRRQYGGVHFFVEEWQHIAENLPAILDYAKQHAGELKTRSDANRAAKAAAKAAK